MPARIRTGVEFYDQFVARLPVQLEMEVQVIGLLVASTAYENHRAFVRYRVLGYV